MVKSSDLTSCGGLDGLSRQIWRVVGRKHPDMGGWGLAAPTGQLASFSPSGTLDLARCPLGYLAHAWTPIGAGGRCFNRSVALGREVDDQWRVVKSSDLTSYEGFWAITRQI